MLEVEQKFRIDDLDAFAAAVQRCGLTSEGTETHRDTYFNHPCRDFAETREAFRVRLADGQPMLTYKGPKLAADVKVRREIELPVGRDLEDAREFEDALRLLGFRPVATVAKVRTVYRWPVEILSADMLITLDRVEGLGEFSELELTLPDTQRLTEAQSAIADLAERLGLRSRESRSYLTIYLDARGSSEPIRPAVDADAAGGPNHNTLKNT